MVGESADIAGVLLGHVLSNGVQGLLLLFVIRSDLVAAVDNVPADGLALFRVRDQGVAQVVHCLHSVCGNVPVKRVDTHAVVPAVHSVGNKDVGMGGHGFIGWVVLFDEHEVGDGLHGRRKLFLEAFDDGSGGLGGCCAVSFGNAVGDQAITYS